MVEELSANWPRRQNYTLALSYKGEQDKEETFVNMLTKYEELQKKKNVRMRTAEMAQRLGALAAVAEVPSSISSNHMMAHNHL